MMTQCRFYVNDKRQVTTRFNLELVEKSWRKGDWQIGDNLGFEANAGIWSHRTDHSLTVVNTEGNVLYWRAV